MVNAPDLPVVAQQCMACLSISVIGQQVKEAYAAQLIIVLLSHREIVVSRVVLHIQLNGAGAMGAVSEDGFWDKVPTQSIREKIRDVLSLMEGAAGKIPERYLSLTRFVDGFQLLLVISLDKNKKRVVGAQRNEVTGNHFACLK